jgi:hypothetical protein
MYNSYSIPLGLQKGSLDLDRTVLKERRWYYELLTAAARQRRAGHVHTAGPGANASELRALRR